MKYTNLRAFEKHLQDASPMHLSSVYMVVSKDDYSKAKAAELLISELMKGAINPEHSLKIFEAHKDLLDEIVEELNTFGFFSKKKLIVVHQAEKLVKADHETLDVFLSKPTPNTTLIFTSSALTSNTTFYKKIEKAGVILDLPEEKQWEKEKSLPSWVMKVVSVSSKKIDSATAQYLVKRVGSDQTAVMKEIEKLLCFIGEKEEITVRDINLLCEETHQETIWQLGEALFKRESGAALQISHALLDEGMSFLGMLRQLRSQFQTDFQISCLLSNGAGPQEVVQQFPYLKGAILERHLNDSKNYGRQKFKEGLLAIDAIELQAKNSGAEEVLLNDILILKLTNI